MKIKLSFQTQDLPPPFAYAAVMQVDLDEKKTCIDFQVEYLGRESLSSEELQAEGFTRHDDFNHSAEVDSVWNEDILSLVNASYQNEPDENSYLHVEVNGDKKGFPVEIETAGVIFQELIQAVLEECKVESPLALSLIVNKEAFKVTWKFAKRIIEVNGSQSGRWSEGRTLMKMIYSQDYEGLNATSKPAQDAVSFEEGLWFETGNKKSWKNIQDILATILQQH